MTTKAEPSGVDLARQALFAAREAAKNNGSGHKEKPRRRTHVARRDGRDPFGLGEAITAMMTERAWATPAAGGDVLAQFDSIIAAAAPELAGHIQAVKFAPDTGQLDIVPEAPAYGTTLRWTAPKLIAQANQQVKGTAVHTIHVLPPPQHHGRRPGSGTNRRAHRPGADPGQCVGRLPPCPRLCAFSQSRTVGWCSRSSRRAGSGSTPATTATTATT
ncbi:DciA family protein [Actinacidiphila soli]|uniref:DciA family protein n=1 Tax=Actinacidiphila soli TaxID=2487275 RepID=UPI001F0C174A|nr:DciA family protein [Actinacidiphila soli]